MKNKQFILLAIVCVITLLPFLGLTDFHTKGEPREAIVSYSMIETGNWILPVNNGGDIAYKPPFFHWCIAAISSITGKVTEYTSRMPSALALNRSCGADREPPGRYRKPRDDLRQRHHRHRRDDRTAQVRETGQEDAPRSHGPGPARIHP